MLNRDLINRSKYVSTLLHTKLILRNYSVGSTQQIPPSKCPKLTAGLPSTRLFAMIRLHYLPLEIKFCVS